ncbi:murein biosynthesis integral membrane protein MurJ [Candidatus Parcubacteria bacterium]|nr:MAG: murein biosynthesis integral membrane protein MurJ [Candidatus Parcubacteria bacterium]
MIRKLLCKIDSISIAALMVALSSLLSRFLGIFRDRILGSEFGLGDTLDIYFAAFRVPDLIFNLIVLGALSAGFIPVFSQLLKKTSAKLNHQKEAWEVANIILSILGLSLILLSGFGILFAPFLTKLIAPGFDPEKMRITANVTRIMFLSPIFLGISSILGGVLQSFKRFFIYSLAPIVYNVGIIFGALFLAPVWGVYGLAYGVVLGAFFHMFIQVPTVYNLGLRFRLSFNFKDKNVLKIATMMLPRTLSLAVGQFNLLVITVIASTMNSGSLSVFNYANNLQTFPVGIFGISFAIAAFPTLSAIAFDKKKLVSSFSSTFRKILFFVVPSTILLLTLRAQIVRVVFGAGSFDWQDTLLTMETLKYFVISLFAQATIPLLVRVFYARHNSSTPFFVGLVSAIINVFLSFYLGKRMGVAGLALAFSISNIINFVLLWIILKLEIGYMNEMRILISTIKFSISAIAAGLTVQGAKLIVWPYIDMTTTLGVFIQGFFAGISGLTVYIAYSALLKSEELFDFWSSIKRRFHGKKIDTGDRGEARGI